MPMQHQLLSVYLSEADRWKGRSLHLEILRFLSRSGCSGGTALRGSAGFTAGTEVVAASSSSSEGRLPLVIHLIDTSEKVAEVLPTLRKMAGRRLITVQETRVVSPES